MNNQRDTTKTQKTGQDTRMISVIHQNVQSIGNCIDELNLFLKQNSECVALCITEHWKTYHQLTAHGVNGFELGASFCREENKHGGSAVYVKCGLPHKEIPKITSMSISGEFECAAVDIRVDNTRIIVSSIYRPPDGNVGVYTSKMEELLSMVFSYKDAIVIIAGDFNIEMYKDNNKQQKQRRPVLTNEFI